MQNRTLLIFIIRISDFFHKPLRAHLILFIGVGFLILGLAGIIPGQIPYLPIAWLPNLHRTISPELIGIGITVLIVDWAIAQREYEREKRELISQLGSPNNENAKEAVRVLNSRRWLIDGTLRQAYLLEANLQGAQLYNADLQEARMWQANMERVDLESANLKKALLWQANLEKANLENANLQETHLVGANLRGANLTGADLRGANLSRADLRDSKLSNANLQNCVYTSNTIWSQTYNPIDSGAILVDNHIGDVLFVTGNYIGQKVIIQSRQPNQSSKPIRVEKASLIYSSLIIRTRPDSEMKSKNKRRYLIYARRLHEGEKLTDLSYEAAREYGVKIQNAQKGIQKAHALLYK